MTADQSKAQPPQSKTPAPTNDETKSVHMLGVTMALRDMAQRLSSLEGSVSGQLNGRPRKGESLIEVCKVIFGGWPALGFLFLVLFYSPLREALNAIPAKVKAAHEIVLPGVSLKSSIQVEAAKLGATNLSETIPRLSSAAVELLLRAPRNLQSMVSYTMDDRQEYDTIYFPSSSMLASMSELQTQGLIEIEGNGTRKITGSDASRLIEEFRRTHPGSEERSSDERVTWKLNTPLPRDANIPMLPWQLTDLGAKAVEIILKAVSTELAPKPLPKSNS